MVKIYRGKNITLSEDILEKYKAVTGTDVLTHFEEFCDTCQRSLPADVSDEDFSEHLRTMLLEEIQLLEE